MENETGKEIIFESWLYKLSGTQKHQVPLNYSGVWNKRYFILERDGNLPCLLYYSKKPKNDKVAPKGFLKLSSLYRIEKRPAMKGKPFVCEIVSESVQLVLASDEEKMFHLFVFFLQTQTKIKDELEGDCFVVRPDNTDDQRCIGSRGNMSLLHVSQSGITLALQLSKCVLAQWPLKCIKFYESTGMGQFGFETGRQSPSGEGKYFFNTRRGQDNQIYDMIDSYVMEADAFRKIAAARPTTASERSSIMSDLDQLQTVTCVYSDSRFLVHLKRISRDMYDNLAAHLGGGRSVMSRNQSDPDLLSDTVPRGRAAAQDDRSCGTQDVSCASSSAKDHCDVSVRVSPPDDHYVVGGARRGPPLMKKVTVPSEYLHMSDGNDGSFGSISPPYRYINANVASPNMASPNMASPPTFYDAMKACEASADVNIRTPQPGANAVPSGKLVRQRSYSCEDLGAYKKMDIAPMSYENEVFAMNDESAEFVDGAYSYASTRDTRVLSRVHHQQRGYQKLQRKSLSNPNLVDGFIHSLDRSRDGVGVPSGSESHHRPSPFDFALINPHTGVRGNTDERQTGLTPSPKSTAQSGKSPGFLRGVQFSQKSRSFVKHQRVIDAVQPEPSSEGKRDSGESVVSGRNMEGRQLPPRPDSIVKETSC